MKARELAIVAAEKLTAAGLPKELAGVLKYDDEKTLDEAINKLSTMKGFDGGENTSKKEGKPIVKIDPLPLPHNSFGDYDFDPIKDAFRLIKE